MKKLMRTTRLTIETERTFIFSTRNIRQPRWCEQCGVEVVMASVDEAAAVSGLKEMTIYQSIETRSLHSVEDKSGRVLVCLNSLQGQKTEDCTENVGRETSRARKE
jgi:hypothetical protein